MIETLNNQLSQLVCFASKVMMDEEDDKVTLTTQEIDQIIENFENLSNSEYDAFLKSANEVYLNDKYWNFSQSETVILTEIEETLRSKVVNFLFVEGILILNEKIDSLIKENPTGNFATCANYLYRLSDLLYFKLSDPSVDNNICKLLQRTDLMETILSFYEVSLTINDSEPYENLVSLIVSYHLFEPNLFVKLQTFFNDNEEKWNRLLPQTRSNEPKKKSIGCLEFFASFDQIQSVTKCTKKSLLRMGTDYDWKSAIWSLAQLIKDIESYETVMTQFNECCTSFDQEKNSKFISCLVEIYGKLCSENSVKELLITLLIQGKKFTIFQNAKFFQHSETSTKFLIDCICRCFVRVYLENKKLFLDKEIDDAIHEHMNTTPKNAKVLKVINDRELQFRIIFEFLEQGDKFDIEKFSKNEFSNLPDDDNDYESNLMFYLFVALNELKIYLTNDLNASMSEKYLELHMYFKNIGSSLSLETVFMQLCFRLTRLCKRYFDVSSDLPKAFLDNMEEFDCNVPMAKMNLIFNETEVSQKVSFTHKKSNSNADNGSLRKFHYRIEMAKRIEKMFQNLNLALQIHLKLTKEMVKTIKLTTPIVQKIILVLFSALLANFDMYYNDKFELLVYGNQELILSTLELLVKESPKDNMRLILDFMETNGDLNPYIHQSCPVLINHLMFHTASEKVLQETILNDDMLVSQLNRCLRKWNDNLKGVQPISEFLKENNKLAHTKDSEVLKNVDVNKLLEKLAVEDAMLKNDL